MLAGYAGLSEDEPFAERKIVIFGVGSCVLFWKPVDVCSWGPNEMVARRL